MGRMLIQDVAPGAPVSIQAMRRPQQAMFASPVSSVPGAPQQDFMPSPGHESPRFSATHQLVIFTEFCQQHAFVIFTLLFLAIGVVGVQVGGRYWSTQMTAKLYATTSAIKNLPHAVAGLNASTTSDQLATKIQAISQQPATLNLGSRTVNISPNTIRSWLKTTTNADTAGIHVDAGTINASLAKLVTQYEKAPKNSVSVTYADGTSAVIYPGNNGLQLSTTADIASQASVLAKNLLAGKGFNINAPLVTMPFASVTPAAYTKFIEVNVSTKQMYLYDNGQLTRQYAVSAGKPSTPTPIGEFQIFSKLAVEDMKGINPNGTPYFQPHVHWINYFLPGGYAIHGVYWHPLSWFGANNSSHGCVGLPDDEAQWVYSWAPIGTTVVTHY